MMMISFLYYYYFHHQYYHYYYRIYYHNSSGSSSSSSSSSRSSSSSSSSSSTNHSSILAADSTWLNNVPDSEVRKITFGEHSFMRLTVTWRLITKYLLPSPLPSHNQVITFLRERLRFWKRMVMVCVLGSASSRYLSKVFFLIPSSILNRRFAKSLFVT